MKAYSKIGWRDHIVDEDTQEVIQEGTPVSENNLGHMDEGIYGVTEQTRSHETELADMANDIQVLKDATLNNMTNNVFVGNFTGLDSMRLVSGIYDATARRVYV